MQRGAVPHGRLGRKHRAVTFHDIACPMCGKGLERGSLPARITPSGAKHHAKCVPCNLDAWLDRRGGGQYALSHFRPGRPFRARRTTNPDSDEDK